MFSLAAGFSEAQQSSPLIDWRHPDRLKGVYELSQGSPWIEATPTPSPTPTPTPTATPSPTPTAYVCPNMDFTICCKSDGDFLSHLDNGALTITFFNGAGGIEGSVCSNGEVHGHVGSGMDFTEYCVTYDHMSPTGLFPLTGMIYHSDIDGGTGLGFGMCWRL